MGVVKFLVFDGAKARAIRGYRPRRVIAELSGGVFKSQDLFNWEKGVCVPRLHAIPALMKALGIQDFAQIASPVEERHLTKKEPYGIPVEFSGGPDIAGVERPREDGA